MMTNYSQFTGSSKTRKYIVNVVLPECKGCVHARTLCAHPLGGSLTAPTLLTLNMSDGNPLFAVMAITIPAGFSPVR